MSVKLNDCYLKPFISSSEYEAIAGEIQSALVTTREKSGAGNDFLGWLDLPENFDKKELFDIEEAAKDIRSMCDVLLVIGIGGSYLGARAAVEFVHGPRYNNLKKDTPDIYFVGNDISPSTVSELLSIVEDRQVCLNVISKSGTTTEPAIAFRIFREYMENKYGEEEAAKRIFVTTDRARGKLKELSDAKGYRTFVVPDDIGGRFSVLTPVGLLPIAVSGADVRAMLQGAADARNAFLFEENIEKNDCLKYAAIRNILLRSGKSIEILAGYEPAFAMTCEWWKQLYGESEGKGGNGLYPASVCFTTDLHSLGQFIQDGTALMFETVLDLKTPKAKTVIPYDPANTDGLNYIAGKSMHEVNRVAMQATALAHVDGGVPNLVIELADRSSYSFGYMVYFFELACAVSGYTIGVNPFDQPGVEAYKKNMFALLGKQGSEFDAIRAAIGEKISK
ncbi:MAG: glucose-6-phosphate isomerase [Ruminococcaceae bacterium]|nr:glucose-6-phosphate isomerase [Oscillospiraceae bacterium]